MSEINREQITDAERAELETRYGFRFRDELEPFLVTLGFDEPFWSLINRNCSKERTRDLDTAGVTVEKGGGFKLYWNPDFIETLSGAHCRGLIIHEFLHLILEHVTTRRRQPHNMWNIATDLAINSLIDPKLIPKCCLYPGPRPPALGPWQELKLPPREGAKPKRKMTTEEKDVSDHMFKLMESFEPKETADYYFERLMNDPKIKEQLAKGTVQIVIGSGDEQVEGGIGGMDDHDLWDELPEDVKDMVREQVRDMVERGIKSCDSSNSWGSVGHEFQKMLRDMIAGQVNWKTLLRQFIGMSITREKTSSIKRINRKYPYIHPGKKCKYRAKIAVYLDMSGSVGDDNIEEMWAELNCLARDVDFSVFAFDTEVNVKERIEWKRGQKRPSIRFNCGGTDFNAPTRHFAKNMAAEGWTACIIMSDGECCKPDPMVHGRRAYIIVPDRKIGFVPDENDILIQMTKEKRK